MDTSLDVPQRLLYRLTGFVASLRQNGLTVGEAEAADATRILASPLAARADLLRPAWRALFCANGAEWRKFDELFAAAWLGHGVRRAIKVSGGSTRTGPRSLRQLAEAGAPSHAPEGADDPQTKPQDPGDNPADGRGRHEGASKQDALKRTDFRHMSDAERTFAAREAAAYLIARLRTRKERRERVRRSGRRVDLRRTLRASIAYGGVPLDRVWRRHRRRPLRLVVLLDASGSMSIYTAVFTRFIAAVIAQSAQAEAFLFHTRLVQISDALRESDPQRAIDRLSLLAEGVGGGTRIGACLQSFHRWHARRCLNSRSVLLIVSDGYDTGAPGELGAAMRHLSRRCRRIVWLNPMLGWPGYVPSARGMAEALQYIKVFAPAHDLKSLLALAPLFTKL
jgi:uncharacterized protein with von Willebrand factor type A (vWA) domain